jgi:hypothetical protein
MKELEATERWQADVHPHKILSKGSDYDMIIIACAMANEMQVFSDLLLRFITISCHTCAVSHL